MSEKTVNTAYQPLIAAILSQQLAEPMVALTPVPTFPDTIVYEAHTAGQQVIFKAMEPDGRDPDGIALEAWACETAAAQGVPAPRVLAVDNSCARFPTSFFIMEKARGQSLAGLRLSPADQQPFLRQVGQALRQLHTVSMDGFGWLDEAHYRQTGRVRGRAPTWRAALLSTAPDGLDYLQHVGALTSQQVDAARQVIEEQSGLLDESSGGRLLHGDLGPIHVWVDEAQQRLTNIVDFGERAAGDPVWDFVDYDWKAVPAILEGYEPNAAMREIFYRKFYLYALLRAIPWAYRWHQRGAVHVVDWLALVIREANRRVGVDA